MVLILVDSGDSYLNSMFSTDGIDVQLSAQSTRWPNMVVKALTVVINLPLIPGVR